MISIIIPVYNVAPYLTQCLESILCQSYDDWECILIDDGSTDGSGGICDEYLEKDTRLHVIHQTNQGVSAARNRGLEEAKGEYVCFVDSDDWVSENYLSDMLKGMSDESVDMVVTGTTHEMGYNKSKEIAPTQSCIFEIDEKNTRIFIENVGLFYGPTSILYKKKIIRTYGISFPIDISFGEDTIFNFCYMDYIGFICLLPQTNYHYRIGNNTLSSQYFAEKPFIRYGIWKRRKNFYISHKMWNNLSKENMYKELWSIIYDGIFSKKEISLSFLKKLFDIEEIKELKYWKDLYNAPNWIKYAIQRKAYLLLYLYLFIRK